MGEPISFISATRAYFSEGTFGRRVEIPEFKALTTKDKKELSEMLTAVGIEHVAFVPPPTEDQS